MNTDYKNILVVKNRAMGDSIMGLSTISYVRDLYPDATITYALPGWIVPMYDNVDTDGDRVISLDLKTISDWPKVWKKLKSLNIDVVYEMHQAGRTAKFFKMYSLINRVPYFFHNHHLKDGTEVHDQGVIKSVIQRDLDGVYSYLSNKLKLPEYLNYTPTMKSKAGIQKTNQITLGVVATRQTKMWDLVNYVTLARLLKKSFPKYNIVVPLSKSQTDLEIKKTLLKEGIEEFATIVHETLSNLPILMAKSSLYIGNDTGLKHLAIATGVKSYTLFGPEPPNEWHPYNSELHPFLYKEGLECRTRDAHYCGLSTCESMICLKEFTPEFVFEAVKKDLGQVEIINE